MESHDYRSSCPITIALDVFGDKWSLLILRDMVFKGKKRYGAFLDSAEKISTNILADRLRKMEKAGLISKEKDPGHGSKFVYGLTPKGQGAIPILLEMIEWSISYEVKPESIENVIEGAPKDLVMQSRTNRKALIEKLL